MIVLPKTANPDHMKSKCFFKKVRNGKRDDVSARYIRIQGRIKKILRIDIDQCNGAGKLILSP